MTPKDQAKELIELLGQEGAEAHALIEVEARQSGRYATYWADVLGEIFALSSIATSSRRTSSSRPVVLSYGGGLDSFCMLVEGVRRGERIDRVAFLDVGDPEHKDPGEWPGTSPIREWTEGSYKKNAEPCATCGAPERDEGDGLGLLARGRVSRPDFPLPVRVDVASVDAMLRFTYSVDAKPPGRGARRITGSAIVLVGDAADVGTWLWEHEGFDTENEKLVAKGGGRIAYLEWIGVTPEGKGWGRKLIDHVLANLERQGIHRVILHPVATEPEAELFDRLLSFYRHAGFEIIFDDGVEDDPFVLMETAL